LLGLIKIIIKLRRRNKMCKLSEETFKNIEKFVVSKGDNPNEDRCVVIEIDFKNSNVEVSCCMDEIESEIRICKIDGQDVQCSQGMLCVNELTELSKKTDYTTMENKKYINYIEEIKMQSDCCDKNCSSCNNNKVF
jgi:hypothetical protein